MASGRVQTEQGHERRVEGGEQQKKGRRNMAIIPRKRPRAKRPREHMAKMSGFYRKETLGEGKRSSAPGLERFQAASIVESWKEPQVLREPYPSLDIDRWENLPGSSSWRCLGNQAQWPGYFLRWFF